MTSGSGASHVVELLVPGSAGGLRPALRETGHSGVHGTEGRQRAMQLLGMSGPVFTALVEESLSAFSLAQVDVAASGEAIDAQVVYANAQCEQFLVIPRAAAPGSWISELLPELCQTWLSAAGAALASGESQPIHAPAPAPAPAPASASASGMPRWIAGCVFPIRREFVGTTFTEGHPASPPSTGNGVAQFGDLSVDLGARTARVGHRDIHLTRTEFDVLAALVAHPRTALSSREIIEHVTGAVWLPTDRRKLAVHVHNLRRKLGVQGSSGHRISTVMGFGYRFDPDS